jgi:nucleoside-diphosphate-sugar epimerase
MAKASKSILMFGATGAIGTFIIKELVSQLDAGKYDRLAIFTSQATIDNKSDVINDLKVRGVEVFVGDVADKDYVRQVLEGTTSPINPGTNLAPFDTVINAAGRNAILTQIPILEVAEIINTVKRYYPSEYGTDIEYDPETSPDEPPHQLKLKVRAFIKEHIKRLEITYLVTGPYSDMWLNKMPENLVHTGSFDVKAKKATVLYDGKQRISFTTMSE